MEGIVRILNNTVAAHMGLPGGAEAVSHRVRAGGVWKDRQRRVDWVRKDCGYMFMILHRLPQRRACGGAIYVARALTNGAKMQLLCHEVEEGEVREDSKVAGNN